MMGDLELPEHGDERQHSGPLAAPLLLAVAAAPPEALRDQPALNLTAGVS